MEINYHMPQIIFMEQIISDEEMIMLRQSQRHGRAHDITFFIIDNRSHIAVIRKHFHPTGVYRAPSGGLAPGEDFESGVLREAYEETGLLIRLEKYLLRINVNFKNKKLTVPWTTHIFSAQVKGGIISPIDTEEIAEAKWITVFELRGKVRSLLLATGKGLFQYRVKLTDIALDLLNC
jgi:8-oxo-dGTP pyrophosphatase MutT (NUDIX family)